MRYPLFDRPDGVRVNFLGASNCSMVARLRWNKYNGPCSEDKLTVYLSVF